MQKYYTRFLIVSPLMIIITPLKAQPASWQWAHTAGGMLQDQGRGICVDAQGNSYMSGTFLDSTITFGSFTLTNSGATDAFVVKYDVSGNVVWAKRFGGSGHDYASGIAADYFGNLYVTGSFSSSVFTFAGSNMVNSGYSNILILKYSTTGTEIWGKRAGGTGSDGGSAITTDLFGNCFVTGYFGSTTVTLGSTVLTNSGAQDIFISKFDISGNPVWAKGAGYYDSDMGAGISADISGNVTAAGYFFSDSISFDGTKLVNGGYANFFAARFDNSGNLLWAKGAAGINALESVLGKGVSTDDAGNSYVVGEFNGAGILFGFTSLSSIPGNYDLFLIKYDAAGNVTWVRKAGAGGGEMVSGVSTDASGNAYITGFFDGATTILGGTILTNNGGLDVFVTEYSAAGSPLWAVNCGGPYHDVPSGIAADDNGNTYIAGQFRSTTINFGSITLPNSMPDSSYDVFIGKLNNTVSIAENGNNEDRFTISPNPATGNIQIAFNTKHNIPVYFEIINTLGKTVFKSIIKDSQSEINLDVSFLVKGIYSVRIGNRKSFENRKLVVK